LCVHQILLLAFEEALQALETEFELIILSLRSVRNTTKLRARVLWML